MAARNASLTFGLLTIPVKLEKVTETKATHSNMCVGQPGQEDHEASPVKMPKTCDHCGPIMDHTVLVKGIKEGASYKIVTQEALAAEKAEYANEYKGAINLVPHPARDFYDATAPGSSINFVLPVDDKAAGHYALLLKLVREHPELAFASLYTPVSATNLFVLREHHGALMLEQRTRTQELKAVPEVSAEVNDALYTMLESVLEGFITPYDPEAYEDKYAAAVRRLAEESDTTVTAGGAQVTSVASVQDDEDLMSKLRALKAAS